MMSALTFIKVCPHCGSHRPAVEMSCENVVESRSCGWPLEDQEIRVAGEIPALVRPIVAEVTCTNGHPLEPGDQVCLIWSRFGNESDSELGRRLWLHTAGWIRGRTSGDSDDH
jgi:hypothetical protein